MILEKLDDFVERLEAIPLESEVVSNHVVDAFGRLLRSGEFIDADRLRGTALKAARLGYFDLIPAVVRWMGGGTEEERLDTGCLFLAGLITINRKGLRIDSLMIDGILLAYARVIDPSFDAVVSTLSVIAEILASPASSGQALQIAREGSRSILARERQRWPAKKFSDLESIIPLPL